MEHFYYGYLSEIVFFYLSKLGTSEEYIFIRLGKNKFIIFTFHNVRQDTFEKYVN